MAPKSVQDKVVLLTGGGAGLGRTIAVVLAERGARVVLWDISKEGMETTKGLVKETVKGALVETMVVDVTKPALVYAAAEEVQKLQWGTGAACPVFAVVNNAGVLPDKTALLETDDSRTTKAFEVNAFAHFWVTKAFLPAMKTAKEGHFVNMASGFGLMAVPKLSAYCSSKSAAVGFAEALRNELKSDPTTANIGCSMVCPCHIKTDLFKDFESPVPSLEPREVAEAAVNGIENDVAVQIMPAVFGRNIMLKALIPASWWDSILAKAGMGKLVDNVDMTHAEGRLRSML